MTITLGENLKVEPKSNINIKSQNEILVGRNEEIKKIKAVANSHNIICITGIGGIGKTTLIRKILKEYGNRPVISFPIFPEITTDWVINQFNKALGFKYGNTHDLIYGLEKIGTIYVHIDDYELISNSKFSVTSPGNNIRLIHNFLTILT